MDQRDNRLFDEIISGEFDEGVPKSIEMFDRSTNEFYQKLDKVVESIQADGQINYDIPIGESIEQIGIYFELAITEIMNQDSDFETKLSDIIGITIADIIRRDVYIGKFMGITVMDNELKDIMRDEFDTVMRSMQQNDIDIARKFSSDYVKTVHSELEGFLTDIIIRSDDEREDW